MASPATFGSASVATSAMMLLMSFRRLRVVLTAAAFRFTASLYACTSAAAASVT